MSAAAEQPVQEEEKSQRREDAKEDVGAEPGGGAAHCAQAGRPLVLIAIGAVAIATDGPRQSLALIARGRCVFVGLLWSPPTGGLVRAERRFGDARSAGIADGDGGRAASAIVVLAAVLF